VCTLRQNSWPSNAFLQNKTHNLTCIEVFTKKLKSKGKVVYTPYILAIMPRILSVRVKTGLPFTLHKNTFLAYSVLFPSGIGKKFLRITSHYLTSPYVNADNEAIAKCVSSTQKNPIEHKVSDDTLQDHSESNR